MSAGGGGLTVMTGQLLLGASFRRLRGAGPDAAEFATDRTVSRCVAFIFAMLTFAVGATLVAERFFVGAFVLLLGLAPLCVLVGGLATTVATFDTTAGVATFDTTTLGQSVARLLIGHPCRRGGVVAAAESHGAVSAFGGPFLGSAAVVPIVALLPRLVALRARDDRAAATCEPRVRLRGYLGLRHDAAATETSRLYVTDRAGAAVDELNQLLLFDLTVPAARAAVAASTLDDFVADYLRDAGVPAATPSPAKLAVPVVAPETAATFFLAAFL